MIFSDGRLFLAGSQRDAPRIPLRAPWDDAVLADVAQATPELLDEALAHGARAAPMMRALPAWRRRAILDGIARGIEQHAATFEDTIVAEAGKPRRFAKNEIARAITTFAFAADRCWQQDDRLLRLDGAPNGEGRMALLRRRPRGLVLAITPFNFPLNLVAHKLAPAFAVGCSVVLKPAEQTPLSALLLAQVCRAAGLPDGALSVVPCDRSIAHRLVEDPRPALLSFTGSANVGWRLKQAAGRRPALLELGGNAAVIVAADVEEAALEDVAARIATGAFAYAGQVCISVQRVLVHRTRLAALRDRLVARAEHTPVGDPRRDDVEAGPLVDDRSVARVRTWCDEASAGGGRRLCGGDPIDEGAGRALRPIVMEDAPADCRLVQEEVFGPALTLHAFDDLDEAIAAVNGSRYGLQAGVFTSNIQTVLRCADALAVGAVIHDDVPTFRVDQMPYGGVKDSGVGREGIPWAFAEYTEPHTLVLKQS